MIKRTICLLVIFCLASAALAQVDSDKEKAYREKAAKVNQDTSKQYGWKHGMAAGLTLTQIAFKDWAQGGENALAYAIGLSGESVDAEEATIWSTAYKFAYGQTKLADQGIRKTNDEIYLETVLIYRIFSEINPYAAATLRTQFAPGFEYNVDGKGTDKEISKFFDPAYLTQSLGAAFRPAPEITTRLGVGMREVLTQDYRQYADSKTPPADKTKVEGGFESVTDAEWKFAENMTLTSKLALFAPFNTLDQIIVRSDNTITARINKLFNVTLNVQLVNDMTVTPRTQVKQALALGINYTIL